MSDMNVNINMTEADLEVFLFPRGRDGNASPERGSERGSEDDGKPSREEERG